MIENIYIREKNPDMTVINKIIRIDRHKMEDNSKI